MVKDLLARVEGSAPDWIKAKRLYVGMERLGLSLPSRPWGVVCSISEGFRAIGEGQAGDEGHC